MVVMFIMSHPRPWGKGGNIYIYCDFPSPKCESASIRVYARLCLQDISYNILLMAFEFSDMVTMDKTLN